MRQIARTLTLVFAAVAVVLFAVSSAPAQCLVPVVAYAPAPQVAYYPPGVSYYAPAVSYYAAAPVYTPAVSYYAPAVSYYAAPAVSYYAPAVSYYSAPSAVSRTYYGLFGRPRETVTRYYP
jgi:hypothetical protein